MVNKGENWENHILTQSSSRPCKMLPASNRNGGTKMDRRLERMCEKCGRPIQTLADALRAPGLFCDDVCEQSKMEDDTWELLKWLVSSEESPVYQKRTRTVSSSARIAPSQSSSCFANRAVEFQAVHCRPPVGCGRPTCTGGKSWQKEPRRQEVS
jgi:hypothetical protein